MSNNGKVYFAHFGNRGQEKHRGVVTLAYTHDAKTNDVQIGAAFCSPKDQFSKAYGRMIAQRRLGSRACLTVEIVPDPGIMTRVIEHANGELGRVKMRFPRWLRKLRLMPGIGQGNRLLTDDEIAQCAALDQLVDDVTA